MIHLGTDFKLTFMQRDINRKSGFCSCFSFIECDTGINVDKRWRRFNSILIIFKSNYECILFVVGQRHFTLTSLLFAATELRDIHYTCCIIINQNDESIDCTLLDTKFTLNVV